MNTKSIIGLIVVIGIIILIAVWLHKAPATPPEPTVSGITAISQTPATATPDVTAPNTSTATTPPAPAKGSGAVISTKTIDGMKIEVTKEGTGPAIASGQTAVMLYTGKLTDGSVFDSTAKRNNDPFSFQLGAGNVIKGWDEGIVGMKVGEQRTLTIPASLGYGAEGRPPVIPANATLVFDVMLVSIQ